MTLMTTKPRLQMLVFILAPGLAAASLLCEFLYGHNHEKARANIREVQASVSEQDFPRVVQERLRTEISGVEGYHQAAPWLAVASLLIALAGSRSYWYGPAPRWQRSIRYGSFVVAGLGLVLSVLRV
jgi:hypothetical protein